MFPDYIIFVLWDPFADNNDKLSLYVVNDTRKGTILSRATQTKADLEEKNNERKNDKVNNRSLLIEEDIKLEMRKVQQDRVKQNTQEINIVSISFYDSTLVNKNPLQKDAQRLDI